MTKLLLIALLVLLNTAADAATPNYGFVTPTVGASQNVWGTLLNTIFGQIDTDLYNLNNNSITVGTGASSIAGALTVSGASNFTGAVTMGAVVVGTTAAGSYALNVQQAGTHQAYFGSTGSNASNVSVDDAAGGQVTGYSFLDAGAAKWIAEKNGSNNWSLVDNVNSKVFIGAVAGGSLSLGGGQNVVITQGGQVNLNGTTGNDTALVVQGNGATGAWAQLFMYSATGSGILGTENNQPLSIETNNTLAITVGTNQIATFVNAPIGVTGTLNSNSTALATNAYADRAALSTQRVVTGSRALNSIYQNTTNKSMNVATTIQVITGQITEVAVTDSSAAPATAVAEMSYTTSSNEYQEMTFVVLPGNYYEIQSTGNASLIIWTEWY